MEGNCYICGVWAKLEKHHVYGGQRRSISEKYGAVVWLCHNCHNEPPDGVHFNKDFDNELKQIGQKAAMQTYGWSIDDFRREFGKSYL